MSNWKWAYGILQAHNIDTTGMTPYDAIERINELREAGTLTAEEAGTCNKILGKDRKAKAPANDKTDVKDQLRASADKLKGKKPVAAINDKKIVTDYKAATAALQAALSKSGGIVTRKGFGDVKVSARLKRAKAYVRKPAEIAMFAAVPAVIKNGIQIAYHENHKGNPHSTYTFAANVKVGNKICMVAVVVAKTTNNFYKLHRVILPDAKDIKKDTD